MATAHVSPYAGTWYPADAHELRALLDERFAESAARNGPFLLPGGIAFVVPHAAPRYSGTVAASVYRHLAASGIRRVLLLGFSHSRRISGLVIPDIDAYSTPLGDVETDRAAAARLLTYGVFRSASSEAVYDHSVEIQMPLLRAAVPEARVVPLYVGALNASERAEAARHLASLIEPGTALVASSDFTHYGRDFGYQPFAADDRIAKRLEELDDRMMDAASSLDPSLFQEELDATGCTICGRAPIGLLLETLSQLHGDEIFQERLDYQTSGEITGDYRHCVSYAGLGYFPVSSFWIGEEEQALLLASARRTLDDFRRTGVRSVVPPERQTAALARHGGAFVTLYRGGELRGCIGHVSERAPLAESIPELALSAALDDPRFRPLDPIEQDLFIEISLLSPLKRVRGPHAVVLGEHGVVLETDGHRALLLPKVPTERGWTLRQFLDALAHKAGVGPRVYEKAGTRLSVFRAQVFHDGVSR